MACSRWSWFEFLFTYQLNWRSMSSKSNPLFSWSAFTTFLTARFNRWQMQPARCTFGACLCTYAMTPLFLPVITLALSHTKDRHTKAWQSSGNHFKNVLPCCCLCACGVGYQFCGNCLILEVSHHYRKEFIPPSWLPSVPKQMVHSAVDLQQQFALSWQVSSQCLLFLFVRSWIVLRSPNPRTLL